MTEFNEAEMNRATFEMFERSPVWKKLYDGAPELAKERLKVLFWGNKYISEGGAEVDKYREYRIQLEARMSYYDFAYLAEHFPKNIKAPREHYIEMRDKVLMRPAMTKARLDEAIAELTKDCTPEDRERIYRTGEICAEAKEFFFFTYDEFFKAVGGNGEACETMGDAFNHGHGPEVDKDMAYFWFRKGALCGHGGCCFQLANMHEQEFDGFYDMKKSLFWLMEGLRRNDYTCKYMLGYRLTLAPGWWEVHHQSEAGAQLLESMLDNDPKGWARYFPAKCYYQGVGVEEDHEIAFSMMKDAADCRNEDAKKMLEEWGIDDMPF